MKYLHFLTISGAMILFASLLEIQAQNNASLFKIEATAKVDDPKWVKLMYSQNPNVWEVEHEYNAYYSKNKFEKGIHTQNYKSWMKLLTSKQYISKDGNIKIPSHAEEQAFRNQAMEHWKRTNTSRSGAGTWTPIGPFETFNLVDGSQAMSSQVNVYTIDQSLSDTSILYCGTETAAVFKSTDKGLNWTCVTESLVLDEVIGTVKIHPTNPSIILFGTKTEIYRSTNGGTSWDFIFSEEDMEPNDILFVPGNNPTDPYFVLVSTEKGLYRSTTNNNGSAFTKILGSPTWDLELKPTSMSTVYLMMSDTNAQEVYFYRSTNKGANFTPITTGWFAGSANNLNNTNTGARMAVTPADSNYIYVALIGDDVSRVQDINWLGVYRSTDGGTTWTLPAGDPGGPYSSSHYCLSHFHPFNIDTPVNGMPYQQEYYNLAIAVSPTDKNKILVGCLNLFQSTDGGATYKGIGGYMNELGYTGYRHPDIQEIEINGDDVWVVTDGGVDKYSTDWNSHVSLNKGINASAYWGFDAGWNEDVLVGGRYHNGNAVIFESYPAGQSRDLGGVESATGYVEKAKNKNIHFSDSRDALMPNLISDPANFISNLGLYPNESYSLPQSAGEFVMHPEVSSRYYLTKDNILYKSEDSGKTFQLLRAFECCPQNRTTGIEVSRSNPNVMYVAQRYPSSSVIWRTDNAGATWDLNASPAAVNTQAGILLSMSAVDEDVLYMAVANPDSSLEKIFYTDDGGDTWANLTTPIFHGETIVQVMMQYGTNHGVYVVTSNKVFYYSTTLNDWQVFMTGLPARFKGHRIQPFYRDGLVRIASYNRGIWSSPMFEPSDPLAQPTIEKDTIHCAREVIQLEDYSVLNHNGATWNWSISPAPEWISDASARNPQVKFGMDGTYNITLTITDGNSLSDSQTISALVVSDQCLTCPPCPGCSSEYSAVGDASIDSCCVTLTPNQSSKSGAIWHEEKIDLSGSFTTTFNLDMDTISSSADGATFTLQNINHDVVGKSGGALGADFTTSFSIAFITYGGKRIELWKNGAKIASSPTYQISGIGPQAVTIQWTANTKTLTVDWNNNGVDLTYNYDIVGQVFDGDSTNIIWGFTAATGGISAEHRVCNITMSACHASLSGGLALSHDQSSSATYTTNGTIITRQNVSGFNTNVEYSAGEKVKLMPGFKGLIGTQIIAEIGGCNQN